MISGRTSGNFLAGLLAILMLVLGAGPALGTTSSQGRFRPGASGVGDDYFPLAGNGGYNVAHYDLWLDYIPADNQLNAIVRIKARATKNLSSFNLDFRGFDIRTLTVDGRRARYVRDGQELTVFPRQKLDRGERFVVRVSYEGQPQNLVDADGFPYGWIPTDDGSFVANEPDGAPTWYPVNDHPTDKASYTFVIRVPKGYTAVANGLLVGRKKFKKSTTFVWDSDDQMASYLSTASIGRFELRKSRLPNGLPNIDAIDVDLLDEDLSALEATPDMLDYFDGVFGRYPFESVGAIVDDADAGYALETQTRPIYSGPPSESTVAHELAHQWVGNYVSPGRWQDIWLNEGFATYSEWLWDEATGGPTVDATFDDLYTVDAADSEFWNPPPGDPGPDHLFAGSVYVRGAMTLQVLRRTVGDDAFFEILHDWINKYADSTATTPDFIALAERVSGQQLDALFDAWLYQEGKPDLP